MLKSSGQAEQSADDTHSQALNIISHLTETLRSPKTLQHREVSDGINGGAQTRHRQS